MRDRSHRFLLGVRTLLLCSAAAAGAPTVPTQWDHLTAVFCAGGHVLQFSHFGGRKASVTCNHLQWYVPGGLPCGSSQVRQLGLLPNVVTSGAVVSAFGKCECQNSLAAHRGDAAAETQLLSSLTGNSRRQLRLQGLQLTLSLCASGVAVGCSSRDVRPTWSPTLR